MGREYELKYQAEPVTLLEIQNKYRDFSQITMETVYYDTPCRTLGLRRWMLRLRLENGSPVCTLKVPLPDGSRGEWEAPAPSVEAAIPNLLRQGAPRELARLSGLEAVCAARFTRRAKLFPLGQTLVELALDQGVFLAGSREEPFSEMEVELKQGEEGEALAFAQALAREYGLTPEPRSKVQRAMALADR